MAYMTVVPDPVPEYMCTKDLIVVTVGGYDLSETVSKAIEGLKFQARKIGCSAVYNVRFSHTTTTINGGYMYTIVAYGSAVEYVT